MQVSLGKTRALQRALAQAGFYQGKIDGQFGPITQAAVDRYFNKYQCKQQAMAALAGFQGRPSPYRPLHPSSSEEMITRSRAADKTGAAAQDRFSQAKPSSVTECKSSGCPCPGPLGTLSARYESGGRGSKAIGHDNTGGWSYGKHQIETKRGTMTRFINHTQKYSPKIHAELEAAGGASGALKGDRQFKQVWKKLADNPEFQRVEHGFITTEHYEPTANNVRKITGLDVAQRSAALRDVVWSVAVQHGPNSPVIARALNGKDTFKLTDEQIIDAIYDERSAERIDSKGRAALKYFSKSTQDVQKGVRKRCEQERYCAKLMLKQAAADQASSPPPAFDPRLL